MQTSQAQAAAVIPQLLAVAALARDTPDNAQFFMQQGAPPPPPLAAIITPMKTTCAYIAQLHSGALPAIVKSAALSPAPALQEAVSRAILSLTSGSESNAAAAAACGAVQAIAAGGCTGDACLWECDVLAALADPCQTHESLTCACAALSRCMPCISTAFSFPFTPCD
jgi:hypothetical protein